MYDNINPDIITSVRKVLGAALRHSFNNWVTVTHIDRRELLHDAITETLLAGDPVMGVQEALRMTRSFLKLRGQDYRAIPTDHTQKKSVLEQTRVMEPAATSTPLPVDLELLSEGELIILSMVGNEIPYSAIAESLGYEGKTPPARYIQNQLTSIRRKLCDGARTQTQAMAWLEAQ